MSILTEDRFRVRTQLGVNMVVEAGQLARRYRRKERRTAERPRQCHHSGPARYLFPFPLYNGRDCDQEIPDQRKTGCDSKYH